MKNLAVHGGKPTRKTLLRFTTPQLDEEEIATITKVIRSKWISEGPNVKQFEEKFSEYIGVKYSVAVSSGTTALHTAYASCGIKEGNEVIVPSFTHISTANAALYLGAKPVFVEINPKTYNIDPTYIKNKITDKTKAIVTVHWAGQPADMKAIEKIAKQNDLILLEDACQAHGAMYHGKKVGTFGSVASFSFYPSKIITTGEGGIITTDDRSIYEMSKLFRNYGQSWERRFYHTVLGYNYRMTDIQAAMGIVQMDKIEEIISKKNKVASKLTKELQKISGICPPYLHKNVRHVFMHYMCKLNEETFGHDRDFVVDALNAENIQARVYIPPVHLQPLYKEKFNYKNGYLPITEKVAKEVLTLPCSPTMNDEDINDIVEALEKIKASQQVSRKSNSPQREVLKGKI